MSILLYSNHMSFFNKKYFLWTLTSDTLIIIHLFLNIFRVFLLHFSRNNKFKARDITWARIWSWNYKVNDKKNLKQYTKCTSSRIFSLFSTASFFQCWTWSSSCFLSLSNSKIRPSICCKDSSSERTFFDFCSNCVFVVKRKYRKKISSVSL